MPALENHVVLDEPQLFLHLIAAPTSVQLFYRELPLLIQLDHLKPKLIHALDAPLIAICHNETWSRRYQLVMSVGRQSEST